MIFNEPKYCEDLLKNKKADLTLPEVSLLARYFRSKGKDNEEIKKELLELLNKRGQHSQRCISNYILDSIKDLNVYQLRPSTEIVIWQEELDKIFELKDIKAQKLMFSLLYIAKYMKYNSNLKDFKDYENLYYKIPLNTAMKFSKLQMPKEMKNDILHMLHVEGFIEATYSGSLKILIEKKTATKEDDVFYKLKPTDKGILFLYSFTDKNVMECTNCGAWFRKGKSAKTVKYCKTCSEEIKKEKTLERVRKYNQNKV